MKEQPLVSVLMTAYNREQLIADAIESVLASTYQNFELIISDDASSDNTVHIAKEFAARDNRVKVWVNEKNEGDYTNRNKAASHANGKYIKYLDSDDKLSPTGLRLMVEAMEQYPNAALGIAQFNNEGNTGVDYPVLLSSEQAYLEHFNGKGTLRFGPTGTIIVREVFFKMGRFGTARFISDTECWLKLAALYPIIKIQPDVVWWRVHKGQEFDVGHQTFTYLRKSYPIYIQSLQSDNCPLKKSDINKIINRLQWKHARDILSLAFAKGKPTLAFAIFREADFGFIKLIKGLLPYSRVKKNFF